MTTSHNSRALPRAIAAVLTGVGLAISSVGYTHDATQTAMTAEARTLTAQLFASPSQVRLVQEQLRAKGFDVAGQVDGIWGDSTTSAVKRFQQANNLPVTGQLDTSLLSALDIGDVLAGETSSKFLDGLLSSDRKNMSNAGYGAPLFVSPAHVAQIQHVLSERGFYKGTVDGVWGDGTAAAVNKYRGSLGLDADTGIDIALLQALNQHCTEVPKLATQVSAAAEGVPLYAGAATLRAMQRELSAKGHDAGAIDGKWGENTRDALRSFQREHDLETTGTLTLPTLAALGVDIKDQSAFEAKSQSAPRTGSEPASVAEERRD